MGYPSGSHDSVMAATTYITINNSFCTFLTYRSIVDVYVDSVKVMYLFPGTDAMNQHKPEA